MPITVTAVPGTPRLAHAIARVLAVLLLPISVAGCEHDRIGTQAAGWAVVDPEQRHPILVSQQPATLNLHIAPGSERLTSAQKGRVLDFVNSSRASDAGNSRFVIAAPGGSANESAAMEAADEVRHLMLASGYAESSISLEAYHAGPGAAPLRVSFTRYVAEAPECGQDWSVNLARNYDNTPYPNFGCAGQRNLAAMIANPADLVGPRTMTERYSDRRDAVFEKYAKGAQTGAADENQTIQKLNSN